jgi:RNA polymerase-binding transcription factor
MPATSILQPASRRSPAARRRGNSQPLPAGNAGQGGLAQRRAQLEARWRDRLERVTALSLAFHDAAASAADRTARTGAGSSRARQLARQAVAERQALAEIEAALGRLTAGQYGWCEQCGRPLAATLLSSQPEARYCAACATVPAPAPAPITAPATAGRVLTSASAVPALSVIAQ